VSEDHTTTIVQPEGARFALDHDAVGLHGVHEEPPLQHSFAGGVVHSTDPDRPLVHMVCWAEEPCRVEGRVTVVGDEESPVAVRMTHEFAGDHHQTLSVDPLEHSLNVSTAAASPIHHALQLRTPLDVRFCNPWHIASDYRVEVNLGNNRVIGIRLTGATVATPQACDEQDCPPATRGRLT
jgi:hypothetical protein